MIVAGVMSGTSADGINVAIVRLLGRGLGLRLQLLGEYQQPYPANVRRAVLGAMNAASTSVAELSRLNFLLAELYAEAVLVAQKQAGAKPALIGCHGQTIYHQGKSASFLGRQIACTWQTGEGAVLAARLDIPVITDFRPADLAAGGKGAPLVPFLDYLIYRDRRIGRVVQNIGGIGNLTAVPAAAKPEQVIAFDTGPGNMVIDAVTERLFGRKYDRDGRIAARGRVLDNIVSQVLRGSFFRARPPKTAGREQFGREFVERFLKACGRAREEDIVATATAITGHSIADALRDFVLRRRGANFREFVVSGGGAKNRALLAMLGAELHRLNLKLRSSGEFGIPSEAKEAIAFAVLAYQTWHRQPSNIPSATGAKRPAVLGKISYP